MIWNTIKAVFPYLLIALLGIGSVMRSNQLSQQIGALQAKLAIQQSSIRDLQKYNMQTRKVTSQYRRSIDTLQDNYRHVRGSLENTLQNTKGTNRIVQQSVIDQLCNAFQGKYCIDGIYTTSTDRADSSVQKTSTTR